MAADKGKKSITIRMRVTPHFNAWLEAAAEVHGLTRSGYLRMVSTNRMRADGIPEPPAPKKKRRK